MLIDRELVSQGEDFQLRGKLGVVEGRESFSARFLWRQRGPGFTIDLWGPLGQGRVRLSGDAQRIAVLDGNGVVLSEGDHAEVMHAHLGWALPLAVLRHLCRHLIPSNRAPKCGQTADGFLLVEDFFSVEELDRFGASVVAAVHHRTSDDDRQLTEKNLYEQTFVQCMRLWEDHTSVRPFTFHPKLCAAAAALLNSDCVRLWHDQALYKEAGGRKTDAHLDYPFWPADKPKSELFDSGASRNMEEVQGLYLGTDKGFELARCGG